MTQFRSRDEQVAIMDQFIRTEPSGPHLAGWIGAQLRAAEARGAAEERGKGAESDRPNAYRWTYRIGGEWRFSEKFPTATSPTRKPKFISPLYTRPANVAALEARVKELEAVLRKVATISSCHAPRKRQGVYLNENKRIRWVSDTARDLARAALKREGGV